MKTKIFDNSGDKKYFTIIPNYIANHSSANDQALYLQMKKITGDQEAICYASEKYFKSKLKIGSKALKKSYQYLLEHKWIEDAGIQIIETKGGDQKTRVYLVKDIWKMNIEYYQGVSEREPLNSKGVSESNQRGVQKETKGVAFEQQIRTMNKNKKKNNRFEIFWSSYPVKKNKKTAEKIWQKLKVDEELFEKIISSLEVHKKNWQDPKFIPYPSTWLNQERWNDEIEDENWTKKIWNNLKNKSKS